MQGPRERACFYLPGVVSAMARELLRCRLECLIGASELLLCTVQRPLQLLDRQKPVGHYELVKALLLQKSPHSTGP